MAAAAIPSRTHRIAIAEVALFSVILVIQFVTRYIQEWRFWHHKSSKTVPRCVFYSWWGLIGLLAQVRIAGAAVVLSDSHPNESDLVVASVLRGIGLSPLLFEMSMVLLRSGQASRTGPGNSRYPKTTRIALRMFRSPIFIGILLVVIGRCIDNLACTIAGSVIFVMTFIFGSGLAIWLKVCYRDVLPDAGNRCVLLVLASLPFYAVRIAYLLLAEYGSVEYSPIFGDTSVIVGMGLLMELIIISLLLTARAVAEPFRFEAEFLMADMTSSKLPALTGERGQE